MATSWGGSFSPENLTDVSLAEAHTAGIKHDANWITWPGEDNWMERYWTGDPHPRHEPIWEVLVEGRMVLLGTTLPNKAFDFLQQEFPDTAILLETARMAAWIGSNLGNISAFISATATEVSLQYLMDMRDAGDADFLKRMVELRDSGHPIARDAVKPLIPRGGFILPDLRPYGFIRPIAEMAYLANYR